MSGFLRPPPNSYRLPSLSSRLGWGLLGALPLAILYLGGPYIVQQLTTQFGVPFPFPIGTVLLLGLGLLVLSVARYVSKPTRAYGAVSAVYAIAILGYLLWIASQSSVQLAYMGATISITFSELVLIATIVPVLMLVGAILTGVEDALHPTERYPFDFPA